MIASFSGRPGFLRCRLVLLALLGLGQGAFADAQGLAERGRKALERGAFDEAATDLWQAVAVFHNEGNSEAEIEASLTLASAYQSIGQQRRAVQTLEGVLKQAAADDKGRLGRIKARLGGALILTQDLQRAETLLKEALETARAGDDVRTVAAILNDQGNLFASQQKFTEAQAAFAEAASLAGKNANPTLSAQALINAAVAATRSGDSSKADALNSQALEALGKLGSTHAKAFLLVTAGRTDRQIESHDTEITRRLTLRAHKSFETGLAIAEELSDVTVQTYALGYLGQMYEKDGQPDAALSLTRRAIFAAQQGQMPEALYRWEWQTGRLLKARGEIDAAIAAYRRAVQTLQPIRNDVSLGYGNAATRLPFRESEGPMFFELADLLLRQATATTDPVKVQQLLLESRDTVEQLKAVELEDYFRDDCVSTQRSKTRAIEAVDPHTAVVYLIPLSDRTEMLVGLASGLKQVTLPVTADSLSTEVREFRRNLETRTTYGYLEQSQHLYDWLIRPIRGILSENHIDTLVFVPDGPLRTVPLASLHDGNRFLIQDFAVAVAPGLSLIEPHPLGREKSRMLLNGLTRSVQGFPPLYFVADEMQTVGQYYGAKALVNEGFTLDTLRHRMTDEQYSIVHIASHGQFDKDVRKTFVLTYDNKLTLNDLESLIRPGQYRGRPVEMLVLSACQTAAGDDRAALGLAGVAVKAGARSALATLWFVNDQSTSALVSELYSQLRQSPTTTKARALQAAQIKLLGDRRFHHPCYWSPYLIIGNWL